MFCLSPLTLIDSKCPCESPPAFQAKRYGDATPIPHKLTINREPATHGLTTSAQSEPTKTDDPRTAIPFGHPLLPEKSSTSDKQCVGALSPDLADAVSRLHRRHLDSTGNLLHKSATPYGRRYSKAALWNVLGRVMGG